MCLDCKEAIDIMNEITAEYGKITPERLLTMFNLYPMESFEYFKKSHSVDKILAACPKTPEFLGKEGAYNLAVLTNMKEQ
jgi:hypothetical protein